MPIQLRVLGIFLGLFFLFYMIYLVRKNKAGVHQISKWLILGFLILIGVIFFDCFEPLVSLLGFKVFANFIFFALIMILLFFIFSLQLSVVKAEKEIILLMQELSLLKAQKKRRY
ncbi:MAG: DUF2304 family protein [Lactovum sp.]